MFTSSSGMRPTISTTVLFLVFKYQMQYLFSRLLNKVYKIQYAIESMVLFDNQ